MGYQNRGYAASGEKMLPEKGVQTFTEAADQQIVALEWSKVSSLVLVSLDCYLTRHKLTRKGRLTGLSCEPACKVIF